MVVETWARRTNNPAAVRKTYSQSQVALAIASSGAPIEQFRTDAAALFEAGRATLGGERLRLVAAQDYENFRVVQRPRDVRELAGAWQWVWDTWGSPERQLAAFDAAYDLIEANHGR